MMKIRNLIIVLSCIILQDTTTSCSFVRSGIIKRAMSFSIKDESVKQLNTIIQTIVRDDPENMYMILAQKAVQECKFKKSADFIELHYINENFKLFIVTLQKKVACDKALAQANRTLQEQIKYRLQQENLNKKKPE